LRYKFLEQKKKISKDVTLIDPYFTYLSNGMAAANNGWIMDWDPLENFITCNKFNCL